MSGKKMEAGCFDQVHDEVHSEHGTPRQRKRHSGRDRDTVHPGVNTVHPGVNMQIPGSGANTVPAWQSPVETTTGMDPGRARYF